MKPTRILMLLAGVMMIAMPIVAMSAAAPQLRAGAQDEHPAAKPVNAMCPIGKEPIVKTAGTIEYKGKIIGFCCPGCAKEFSAWPETKRDEFVALAMVGDEPGQVEHGKKSGDADAKNDEVKSDLYTLETCPVTGKKLGSMGEPVVRVFNGREVRFCCAGCVEPFEKESAKYFKAIDEKLIDLQLPYYPTDTCIVMGDPLYWNGEDVAVNYIYRNRLVRFCCKMCIKEFNASPEKFLEQIDKQVIEHQREHYPLATCVVSNQKLGSMGEPVERIYGNRLVRFCCDGCIEPFEKEPARYISMLTMAWEAQHETHGEHSRPHGHDHPH